MKEEWVDLTFHNTIYDFKKDYLIGMNDDPSDPTFMTPFGKHPAKEIIEDRSRRRTIDWFLEAARKYNAEVLTIRVGGITDDEVELSETKSFTMDCKCMKQDELFDAFMSHFSEWVDKGFRRIRHIEDIYRVNSTDDE